MVINVKHELSKSFYNDIDIDIDDDIDDDIDVDIDDDIECSA